MDEKQVWFNPLTAAAFDWLVDLEDWKNFLTLTFRDAVTPVFADKCFKVFIAKMNEARFGSHYTRICGHSYFSYAQGIEYQKRDVVHFHVLTTGFMDYALIHDIWNQLAGNAWVQHINDRVAAVKYTVKYLVKQGDIRVYQSAKREWFDDDKMFVSSVIRLENKRVLN